MPFTYILHSHKLNKFYIGHTSPSVEERLKKHLSNHKGFSAQAKDWRIVYSREFESKSKAYAHEREIKNWKSRDKINEIISQK
jgi:putative endonuclease